MVYRWNSISIICFVQFFLSQISIKYTVLKYTKLVCEQKEKFKKQIEKEVVSLKFLSYTSDLVNELYGNMISDNDI